MPASGFSRGRIRSWWPFVGLKGQPWQPLRPALQGSKGLVTASDSLANVLPGTTLGKDGAGKVQNTPAAAAARVTRDGQCWSTQAKQTCSSCKDRKFQSDHAKMLPSTLNCMTSPVDLGNLCAGRRVMNTPSQPEY
ncbi:hypothetical protein EK904_013560 [Melospiza melodia maxima]|nr:hypothetical protein EK904_013560 [Melospiza melodia maxima]